MPTATPVAVVTGGDRGLGLETCRQLGGRGMRVVLTARDPEAVGRVDVLVNNAGVYLDRGVAALDVDLEAVRRTMEVNGYGPLRLCQTLVPMMCRRGYGRVVNVSSGSGSFAEMGTGGTLAYGASKTWLNAMTRKVALEAEDDGVLVNAACPGWVRTRMGGTEAPKSPEEGADTIVWLATLPESGPTGGFYRDRERIPW